MLERFHKLSKTNFAKRVTTLFGANMVSHLILLFNLFIIARIFKLEALGEFQVLISYVAISGTYSLLSYQMAIQTSVNKDLPYLVLGSVFISTLTSSLTALVLWIFNYQYFLYVGIFTFLGSITLIIDSINIRKQQTHMIGIRKIFQPTVQTVYLILCLANILQASLQSLILASIFAVLSSCFIFSMQFIHLVKSSYQDLKTVYKTMLEHLKGSTLLSASDVLNAMAYNVPTIVIDKFFGAVFAAYYSTILRICNVPIALIADSISKVYLGMLSNESQNNTSKISLNNFYKLNLFMIITSIIGFIIIIMLLPFVVEIVLGERWLEAAKMGQILAPLFCLGYLVTPLSMIMYVLKKQMDVLKFQFSYFMISIISFAYGVFMDDIYIALISFSAFSAIRYLFIYYKLVIYARENGY